MGALALFLLVRGSGGSYAIAGLAVSAATLGTSFGSPVLGRLIDRQGQTRVLFLSMLVQVVSLLALAVLTPAGGFLLFGLCVVYGFANPPLAASMRAGWSTLFTDRSQLTQAFALDSTAQEVIWILGPLLSASIAASIDPRATLVAMAAFSAIGVTWFATSQQSRTWRSAHVGERHLLGPLTAGPVRRVLAAILGLAFAWGALELAIAAYADATDHSAGPLLAVWAVGSVVGGLLFTLRSTSTLVTAATTDAGNPADSELSRLRRTAACPDAMAARSAARGHWRGQCPRHCDAVRLDRVAGASRHGDGGLYVGLDNVYSRHWRWRGERRYRFGRHRAPCSILVGGDRGRSSSANRRSTPPWAS